MAVKDVKIYTGAAEGWVSIGDLSTLPISDNRDPVTVTLDSPSANTFTISTGGQARVTVTDAAATFDGQVQTDKITSQSGAATEAAIELGANLIAGVGTGGSFIVQTNNVGKFFIDSNGYATFKPLNVERVAVDGEGLKVKQFKGADDTYGKDLSRIQLRNTDDTDSSLTIVSYGAGIEELQTFCGVGPNGVGVLGRTDRPFAIGTEFNQPLYLSANNLKQVEITQDDVTFTKNIKTPSVSGLAANDAAIELDANLTVSTGAVERLKISNDSADFALPIQEIDGTAAAPSYTFSDNPNTGLYRVGAGQIGVSTGGINRATFANTIATFATSVKVESSTFSPLNIVSSSENAFVKIDARDSSWWNGVVGETYQIQGKPDEDTYSVFTANSDGSIDLPYGLRQLKCLTVIAEGQIQTDKIVGPADTDASLELGANATISTGGETRFDFKNGTHPYGVIQTATGGGSNSVSYFQSNECKGAKASHIGLQVNTTAAGDGNTIGNGFGVACNPPNNTNAITGEWKSFSVSIPDNPATTSYGYYAAAGSFQDDNWAFYAEDQLQSYFGGGMFTPKITGSAAPATDAAIELSANATISTGGVAIEQWKAGTANPIYVTPRPDTNNFKGVRYRTYAGAASGSSIVSALSVNDAVDATILNSFYAEPASLNGSGTLAELRGYYAEDGGGACGKYIAYYSDVKDRRNEANPDDRCETWFVYGLSDAPSYFGGDIQTAKIVGSQAPETDASIELGTELLTSNHTPTQPNSIATKSYVDSSAGSAGLVPFGTPTDDTTPDSPNGSTLHDNLYLYVKGTTTWKKSALYPLDSSGGGSNFPIPQPGENSGEVWETVQFRSGSSVNVNDAAVSATGNVFFLNNSWSVDGKDWYQVVWNFGGGQTTSSYGIVSEECRYASVGNGVYCGQYGYSYDGQSWNLYSSNGNISEAYGSSFFWEGKHWCFGGKYYFDGEALQKSPNFDAIDGNIGNRPLVKKSDTVLMMLNLVLENGSYSRGALKRWEGDMETGNWVSQGAGASDFLQACHGIAWNSNSDTWVFLTNDKAYVQKTSGNYSQANFDEISLPTTSDWADLTFDGNRFVAVADTAGANVSIWSEDGRTWTISNELSNPGLNNLAGFNGRVVGAGAVSNIDDVTCVVTGDPVDSITTATLPLGTPVDTRSAVAADASPLARLETQADANGYFDEEIKKRAVVVTLTQDAYDAIPADEIDDSTLYLITS